MITTEYRNRLQARSDGRTDGRKDGRLKIKRDSLGRTIAMRWSRSDAEKSREGPADETRRQEERSEFSSRFFETFFDDQRFFDVRASSDEE